MKFSKTILFIASYYAILAVLGVHADTLLNTSLFGITNYAYWELWGQVNAD